MDRRIGLPGRFSEDSKLQAACIDCISHFPSLKYLDEGSPPQGILQTLNAAARQLGAKEAYVQAKCFSQDKVAECINSFGKETVNGLPRSFKVYKNLMNIFIHTRGDQPPSRFSTIRIAAETLLNPEYPRKYAFEISEHFRQMVKVFPKQNIGQMVELFGEPDTVKCITRFMTKKDLDPNTAVDRGSHPFVVFDTLLSILLKTSSRNTFTSAVDAILRYEERLADKITRALKEYAGWAVRGSANPRKSLLQCADAFGAKPVRECLSLLEPQNASKVLSGLTELLRSTDQPTAIKGAESVLAYLRCKRRGKGFAQEASHKEEFAINVSEHIRRLAHPSKNRYRGVLTVYPYAVTLADSSVVSCLSSYPLLSALELLEVFSRIYLETEVSISPKMNVAIEHPGFQSVVATAGIISFYKEKNIEHREQLAFYLGTKMGSLASSLNSHEAIVKFAQVLKEGRVMASITAFPANPTRRGQPPHSFTIVDDLMSCYASTINNAFAYSVVVEGADTILNYKRSGDKRGGRFGEDLALLVSSHLASFSWNCKSSDWVTAYLDFINRPEVVGCVMCFDIYPKRTGEKAPALETLDIFGDIYPCAASSIRDFGGLEAAIETVSSYLKTGTPDSDILALEVARKIRVFSREHRSGDWIVAYNQVLNDQAVVSCLSRYPVRPTDYSPETAPAFKVLSDLTRIFSLIAEHPKSFEIMSECARTISGYRGKRALLVSDYLRGTAITSGSPDDILRDCEGIKNKIVRN